MPWIADTVLKTIDACSSLMNAFGSVVQLPPPIAPGYMVFVRGYHNEAFAELLSIQSGGSVCGGIFQQPGDNNQVTTTGGHAEPMENTITIDARSFEKPLAEFGEDN